MSEVLLKLEEISKRFPGVQALDRVSMDLRASEVHAVIGENGAGKSTLMRVLAGAEIPDAGRIILQGREVLFRTPLDAQQAGIGIVYQELSVFPNLSVAENIFANRQPVGPGKVLRRAELHEGARRLMDIFALGFGPEVMVRDLDVADRQMVEILRAVSLEPKVLILDEPTSSLTLAETEQLFRLVERLRNQGLAVLYVSHQLQEVLRLADRITVLRDGQYVATVPRREASEAGLVQMMVGRAVDLYKDYGLRTKQPEIALRVSGLSRPHAFQDISFELHKGEILGFSGLVGCGRTDLAQAIFGIYPFDAGEMELLGEPFAPKEPRESIRRGLAYMPEDRKKVGLFLDMTLSDNVGATQLPRFTHWLLLDDRGIAKLTQRYIQAMNVVARSVRQKAMTLSGGNQQKLLLSMWLSLEPQILIVDEPTRGVDVGAKAEIHNTLRRLADEGLSIMLVSSELPEVLTMSDRIAVMREGRLCGTIPREEASEERIMAIASGVVEAEVGNV